MIHFSSVQFSHSVVSDSLWPHGLQHAKPPCPSPTSGVYSNSYPLSRWCHPTISSSAIPFSSCPQSFPESGSFLLSLRIRWLKNWNFRFSISPSSEYSGLISFRIDSLGSLLSKALKSLLQNYVMPSPRITSTFLFPFSGWSSCIFRAIETQRKWTGTTSFFPLSCPPSPPSAVLHPREASLWLQKETWLRSWWGLSKEWENNNSLRQQSPNFLAPGTDFMEDEFSTEEEGDSSGSNVSSGEWWGATGKDEALLIHWPLPSCSAALFWTGGWGTPVLKDFTILCGLTTKS